MQGVILSAGTAQGTILGDDGNRYTFTPLGWRDESVGPQARMRVEFEPRGDQAVGVYPITGSVPTPPAAPEVPPAPPARELPPTPGALPMPGPLPPTPGAAPAPGVPRAEPTGAFPPGPPTEQGTPPTQPPPEKEGFLTALRQRMPAGFGAALRQQLPAGFVTELRQRLPAGFGAEWWHWALAGGGALVVLVAVALWVLWPSGPPIGKEIARHTHEGRTYTLVEYGGKLAIFSSSGTPVGQRELAEDILHSFAWRQVISEFDIEELADVSGKVRRLDDSVSDVRNFSNSVVGILDELDGMKVSIPLLGSISAMDVVRESFSGVEEAEYLIRSLDSELNALGDNSASLTRATERIRDMEPSSVSADEMEGLFTDAAGAAGDLESSARSVKEFVSDVREDVGELAGALRAGSDTPVIGEAFRGFARSAERFESELSGLSSMLGGLESELGALEEDMRDAIKSAEKILLADMRRWLAEPYDTEWPPTDPERLPGGASASPAETRQSSAPARTSSSMPVSGSTPDGANAPFKLEWEVGVSGVEAGESFLLTVRMYGVREAGEHGGISVSFPSLTRSGGSKEQHSSSVADVEALDYTSGTSNVTFHQPGATIYHRQGNRQFPADYLLVESDDPSWSRSADRTLVLEITPKRGGEFPIQIRGWVCQDGYTDCGRNPDSGTARDQQGWVVERVSVSVTE